MTKTQYYLRQIVEASQSLLGELNRIRPGDGLRFTHGGYRLLRPVLYGIPRGDEHPTALRPAVEALILGSYADQYRIGTNGGDPERRESLRSLLRTLVDLYHEAWKEERKLAA